MDTPGGDSDTEAVAVLRAVDLLLCLARERVTPSLATDGDPYERAILVALFARSVPLTESIVQLGRDGYGRFGDFGHKSWTGLSTRARVASIEEQFENADDREQLWLALDVLNAASNAELHPSAWSLGRALQRVQAPDGSETLQFRPASEPELVAFALTQAWWVFGQLLAVIHTAAGLPKEELLEAGDSGHALMERARAESWDA